jgi:signal transduction histidine kinase
MSNRSTIHRKFIAVAIAVVIPFLLLDIYWVYENAQESKQAAQSNAQLLAKLVAVNLDGNLHTTPAPAVIESAFYKTVDRLEWPPGATITLINEQGTVVARHPNPDGWIGKKINSLEFIGQARPSSSQSGLMQETPGQEQLWGMAQSGDGHWKAVIQIPAAVAYADAWSDMRRNLLFTGFITLFVLGLARFLSHRITRPLRQLAQHMQAVKTGDWPAHIEVRTHDETQLLAESFNIMATKLRERETEKAQLIAELKHHQSELEFLSAQLLRLQEEERRRVARELHDEIGQALGAITLNLQVAERTIEQERHRALDHIADAKAIARRAGQEINRIAHDLRPSVLDDFGLVAALRWYTTDFANRTGIAVQLDVEEVEERLPPEVEVTLYRTVQEALTNSFKHAEATKVRILVSRQHQLLSLQIEDNGNGFEPERATHRLKSNGHLGLLGMRERAGCLGARFNIDSSPGCGTTVRLEVPLS